MPIFDEFHLGSKFKTDVWDRFIRNPHELRKRHHSFMVEPETDEHSDAIVNKKLYSSSEETFKKLLAEALSVSIEAKHWSPMWPVRPRSKPYVDSACAILDLPNIRNSFCSSLMDWSSTDYLTVAFPSSVYLWHAPTNTTVRFPVAHTACVKWTHDGKYLFTASSRGTYKLTNMEYRNNSCISGTCSCHTNCYITCCSFHPHGNLLLTGCSEGGFSVYYQHKDKNMTLLFYQQDFVGSITSVEFSCDGKHFAVSSISGKVGIYATLYKKTLFFVKMGGPVRALSWHPWDRSCLVVADSIGNMNLYDVLANEELRAKYTSIYDVPIVSVSFNPLSAELAVSHRLHGTLNDIPYNSTQLNVLASFDRVVDRLEGHTGRVLAMSWSPDGTKLASCGSDETARIWNFLPQDRKRQLTPKDSGSYFTSTVTQLERRLGLALR